MDVNLLLVRFRSVDLRLFSQASEVSYHSILQLLDFVSVSCSISVSILFVFVGSLLFLFLYFKKKCYLKSGRIDSVFNLPAYPEGLACENSKCCLLKNVNIWGILSWRYVSLNMEIASKKK